MTETPSSVAAGAVSVISLSLQLLGGCIKGFILLFTANNLGQDSSTIICMLHIQEIQLTEWGWRSGILRDEGILDLCLNARPVEESLRRLQDLLLDAKQHKKRYCLDIGENSMPEPRSSGLIEAPSESPSVSAGSSNETHRWILRKAGISQEPGITRRLWWADVGKEKVTGLVFDVQSLIRRLWGLLDPWRQDDLLDATKRMGS
ncbi:prion-inhibition and propagation-domain-containing protein [Penicillium argentinense]|uniref:Prion-inhibition and propagation-domain-containing protein n=1 Tax=Penicillium argentinense TaxID=1131581 RepID=A0A9W9FMW0_9EURO|nr:prion-inhibition and propagation-domain-containing protein [Penicillium argentinense]KAJ5103038.1 prion-inhibition and propagation-domain-containing protein [Penicillium argentinense]